jgi:ABC-2 type transport system permease protein
MRATWAIYRRELGHYFVSPIAYIVGGIFLLLAGYFFNGITVFMVNAGLQASQFGQPVDVPGLIVRNFFEIMGTLTLFLVPMLTMGVFAEEKKRGTIELLMTSPIREVELVLGKFLATLTFYAVLLIPTLAYLVFLYRYSEPRPGWKLLLAGYAGVLLLAAALIALGVFLSSLTENQIVAAVLTFGVFLILWVLDIGSRDSDTGLSGLLRQLSVLRHYEDFTMGVVDLAGLVYFLSFAVFMVFLTLRSLDSMRWRGA